MRTSDPEMALATFAVAVAFAQTDAPERGLVGYWSFDEADGDVARDMSGAGNDGTIFGATRVSSPHGQALHFDGQGDYVDCGSDPSLNISGDMTVSVWIRPETLEGRNRMVFGDASGLTIHRNHNLRFDRGDLRFEYANDQVYGIITRPAGNIADGQWHHIALICEAPRYYLYLDGERVESGDMLMPITPTEGATRRIGGWFAGYFLGDIDEVRLYARAVTEGEALALAEASATGPVRMDLRSQLKYRTREALAGLLCDGPLRAGSVARFELMRGDEVIAHGGPADLLQTRAGSQRWAGQWVFDAKAIPPGDYQVRASVSAPNGAEIGRAFAELHYPEPPVWLGSNEGRSDAVLPPFTPVECEAAADTLALGVCGRRYAFAGGPLPSSLVSADEELLTGACRIVATVHGREVECGQARARVTDQSAGRVSFAFNGELVAGEGSLEYDGLLMLDMTLGSEQATTLDALAIEVPLRPERAKYLYTWPQVHSGTLEDYASGFQPIVWIGDEERGLSWLCESDQGWLLDDPGRAIEVRRGDDEVVLRLNLVDRPTELRADEGLHYRFALQATPLRPPGRDMWEDRLVRSQWYGEAMSMGEKMVGDTPALEHYAAKGARALLVLRWWDAFAYPLPIGHEDEFRKMVADYHAAGLEVVPYVGGFLLSDEAPEAELFRDEMAKMPMQPFPIRLPGLKSQMATVVCQRSLWQDFLVDGIARLIDEYDVDGVYLDTTTRPYACMNELHGCGYIKPDGSRGVTYPVFSVRENLRRIYTAVTTRKPDGIVDVHVYDCMNGPALAWATSYWNGEQLPRDVEFKPEALPLDRFRCEFMGRNWGVPADLLYYKLGDYRKCVAIAGLHDVPVRTEKLPDLEIQSALWGLRDEFGCRDAEWLPYWSNEEYVQVEPADCYASLHRHEANGVLAFVSNLSRKQTSVRMTLDLQALGLAGTVQARDGISGEEIAITGGVVEMELASQDWRTVVLTAD